ncbi:hypothetical protein ACQZV8_10005 [Magnetococcales bacterium HHB-1]
MIKTLQQHSKTVFIATTLTIIPIIFDTLWFADWPVGGVMSGWFLAAMLFYLASLSVPITFFPFKTLQSSYYLVEKHIIIGTASLFLAIFHIGTLSLGILEFIIIFLFILISITGALHLFVCFHIPSTIDSNVEQTIMVPGSGKKERLNIAILHNLNILVQSVQAPFVVEYLLDTVIDTIYMSQTSSRHFIAKHAKAIRHLNDLERYLNPEEKKIVNQIRILIDHKKAEEQILQQYDSLNRWRQLHTPTIVLLLFLLILHIVSIYFFRIW